MAVVLQLPRSVVHLVPGAGLDKPEARLLHLARDRIDVGLLADVAVEAEVEGALVHEGESGAGAVFRRHELARRHGSRAAVREGPDDVVARTVLGLHEAVVVVADLDRLVEFEREIRSRAQLSDVDAGDRTADGRVREGEVDAARAGSGARHDELAVFGLVGRHVRTDRENAALDARVGVSGERAHADVDRAGVFRGARNRDVPVSHADSTRVPEACGIAEGLVVRHDNFGALVDRRDAGVAVFSRQRDGTGLGRKAAVAGELRRERAVLAFLSRKGKGLAIKDRNFLQLPGDADIAARSTHAVAVGALGDFFSTGGIGDAEGLISVRPDLIAVLVDELERAFARDAVGGRNENRRNVGALRFGDDILSREAELAGGVARIGVDEERLVDHDLVDAVLPEGVHLKAGVRKTVRTRSRGPGEVELRSVDREVAELLSARDRELRGVDSGEVLARNHFVHREHGVRKGEDAGEVLQLAGIADREDAAIRRNLEVAVAGDG